MATKKKETPVEETPVEETLVEEAPVEVCGHVNMHALNSAGELAKPKCAQKAGHTGPHTDGNSYWRDEAGKPVA